MFVSSPKAAKVLVPIRYGEALRSTLLNLRTLKCYSILFFMYGSFSQATTCLEPISSLSFLSTTAVVVPVTYREALLNPLLHVIFITSCYIMPSTYPLYRSITVPSSTCKSHSHSKSDNRLIANKLQRSATAQTFNYKSHFYKP
jgi:hypothetical protein